MNKRRASAIIHSRVYWLFDSPIGNIGQIGKRVVLNVYISCLNRYQSRNEDTGSSSTDSNSIAY